MLVHIQKSILMLHQNCIWCGSCWLIAFYYVLFMLLLLVFLTVIWLLFHFLEQIKMVSRTWFFHKVPRFDPSNLMWVQWFLWNMHHGGRKLADSGDYGENGQAFCLFNFQLEKTILRESALDSVGMVSTLPNSLSMTLGVFWWYITWLAGVCPLHWCART